MNKSLWREAYVEISSSGVLGRKDANVDSFTYSDTAEDYLLNALKAVADLSHNSQELASLIKDWPSEYHLSQVRGNILRPFASLLSGQKSVLEIGCGCGAITRQLGQMGAEVIALEGAFSRALVTRERCRDLKNITVVCDNFSQFNGCGQFDIVTLIGVLEYARAFFGGSTAPQEMLERARMMLKPGGMLILAIENQLGLKYFAGHEEDHVGIPYRGIQDSYGAKTSVTFGRTALASLITEAGFASSEFFYPFPDYKLPSVIFSEDGISNEYINAADILLGHSSRSYNGLVSLSFDEQLTWQALQKNGLVKDFANSFLVFCNLDTKRTQQSDFLALQYSTVSQDSSIIETAFIRQPNEVTIVRKHKVYGNAPTGYTTEISKDEYVQGHNLLGLLRRALVAEASPDTVHSIFHLWIRFLSDSATTKGSDLNNWKLPPNFVDCVPHNLIVPTQYHFDNIGECSPAEVAYIDREWVCDASVSFFWVLLRGIAGSLSRVSYYGHFEGNQCCKVIYDICLKSGFKIEREMWITANEMERRLVKKAKSMAISEEFVFLEEFMGSILMNKIGALQKGLEETRRIVRSVADAHRDTHRIIFEQNEIISQRDHSLRQVNDELTITTDKLISVTAMAQQNEIYLIKAQQMIAELKETVDKLDSTLNAIKSSKSWMMTQQLKRLIRKISKLAAWPKGYQKTNYLKKHINQFSK